MKPLVIGAMLGIAWSVHSVRAATFTVNDAFAGTGTIDLPLAVGAAEVFRWPGFYDPYSAPFTAAGQFPSGTSWGVGRVDHYTSLLDTGAPDFLNFNRYHIRFFLGAGGGKAAALTFSVFEELTYDIFQGSSMISNPTINITAGGINLSFAPDGLPPGDFSDGDLAYLFDQTSRYVIPEAPSRATTCLLAAILSLSALYGQKDWLLKRKPAA